MEYDSMFDVSDQIIYKMTQNIIISDHIYLNISQSQSHWDCSRKLSFGLIGRYLVMFN